MECLDQMSKASRQRQRVPAGAQTANVESCIQSWSLITKWYRWFDDKTPDDKQPSGSKCPAVPFVRAVLERLVVY